MCVRGGGVSEAAFRQKVVQAVLFRKYLHNGVFLDVCFPIKTEFVYDMKGNAERPQLFYSYF